MIKLPKYFFLFLLLSLCTWSAHAQKSLSSAQDIFSYSSSARTIALKPTPKAIMWRSVILPGLGQITNKHYWKVPIFYAGFAGTIYYFSISRTQYLDFKQAYIFRTDNDPSTIDNYDPVNGNAEIKYTSENQLKYLRDLHRRNMEVSVILTAGIYALNILDAYVSAHLREFDISDDLTMSLNTPFIYIRDNQKYFYSGFTLTF